MLVKTISRAIHQQMHFSSSLWVLCLCFIEQLNRALNRVAEHNPYELHPSTAGGAISLSDLAKNILQRLVPTITSFFLSLIYWISNLNPFNA